jgi:glycosyltransferase involved in cell wall biosynthesis
VATLESPLPAALPTRTATAVFVYGRGADAIVVDGRRHRAQTAAGAFWGVVSIPPHERPGAVEIALGTGGDLAPAARIEIVDRQARPAATDDRIAICMATHEPDPRLFEAQLESLRAQTDGRWVCVISDDASGTDVAAAVAGDERFVVSRSDERRGFYRNFERALGLAPPECGLIALCDQDDRWHPDKLATLRAALGDAAMVYSDQRLVDAGGRVLRDTLWEGRRNNHTDIESMLVANSVTGAATLFRREVADLALPFPETPGMAFHDHWLGLVALAAGDVAYVDRPLYDYVQHGAAVFGDVSQGGAEQGATSARGAYFRGYVHRQVLAEALIARAGHRLAPGKRRQLERFVAAERSPIAFAWLLSRALTRRRETLGSELELARGIVWRRSRPRNAAMPDLLSYQQRRLRRWRARI